MSYVDRFFPPPTPEQEQDREEMQQLIQMMEPRPTPREIVDEIRREFRLVVAQSFQRGPLVAGSGRVGGENNKRNTRAYGN